ncbi:RDD family protein [Verticiella sediminum]|uniref:RDD family protein n=1 Tax=Verticiella sediminum TaxID=1247510 RepID=A0A556A974_9BURK|nr:RDD family protein [Verticiella sediminum]TSH89429.1 RDD family protein [Verticiella sediminum]
MQSPSPPLPLVSRSRRFACMLYEAVLLFGVVFIADYLFDTLTQSTHALMLRPWRQAWLFVVIGAYFVLSWRRGQTLPMKTWNIRLVDGDGTPPGLARSIARYVLAWLPVLLGAALVALVRWATGWPGVLSLVVFAPMALFVWSWIDRQGQFLHDRLLGTRLVSDER